MRKRIKELENELARKEGNNNNRNNQPKNLQVPPRNGGGEYSNLIPNREMENQQNISPERQTDPIEINDILQIISTTMATLKDFESRYKNAKST